MPALQIMISSPPKEATDLVDLANLGIVRHIHAEGEGLDAISLRMRAAVSSAFASLISAMATWHPLSGQARGQCLAQALRGARHHRRPASNRRKGRDFGLSA